jgi:hypothetical protein
MSARMNRVGWGAAAGSVITLLALLCVEVWQPGFLALRERAGWASIAFCATGGAALGAAVALLFAPPEGMRTYLVGGTAALLTVVAGTALVNRVRERPLPSSLDPPFKVLIFGLDGATWDVIEPMRRAGKLPAFDRLQREGVTGTLLSESPTLSPRVWTTLASGVGPEEHGALDFYTTQASVRVARLWDVVHQRGGSVGIWGWLLTWPPVEVNGFMVPDWLARGPETWPEDLRFSQVLRGSTGEEVRVGELSTIALQAVAHGMRLPTLLRAVRLAVVLKVLKPDDRHSTPPIAIFQGELASDAFLRVYRQTRPDLGAIVLYGTDSLAHRYWRDFEPSKFGIDATSERPFEDAIPAAYRLADRTLARLFEAADEETVLVVISDHGTAGQGTAYRSWVLKPQELVKQLGLEDKVGAFSVGHLVELQHQGASPAEIEALGGRLRDVRIGERALLEVRSSVASGWSVALNIDPDPSDEITIDGRQIPVAQLMSRNDFDGMHTEQGIVALWGPPVRRGVRIEDATLRDIAPTVLALLGCPTSRRLSGELLADALHPRWAERLRTEPVDAFPAALHLLETPAAHSPATGSDEVRKKLKALGYLQ